MPVLDARALDMDPEGVAFLLSVLRQTSAPKILPKTIPGVGRIRFRIISRLRVAGRSKEALSSPA
jgi:hypothetical protein